MVTVKTPSIARGDVTVRCTTMDGGLIVRADDQLGPKPTTHDTERFVLQAKTP